MDADSGDEIFTLFGAHAETALAETLPKAAGCCLTIVLIATSACHEESISYLGQLDFKTCQKNLPNSQLKTFRNWYLLKER